jgi:hypothetical protein
MSICIYRVSLTRFRTSTHQLQIEVGRYTAPKTPIIERICRNCSSNSIEDEQHFLLFCQKYNELRNKLIIPCLNKNISNTNNYEAHFIWLLSNEDPNICKNIAKYINLCSTVRLDTIYKYKV